ncbi:MAG: hypothetical protein K2X32_05380 [Phycisphaerales bacterium]|nr:hypothetical protein [Phycisphaerales bacterium]
MAAIGVNYGGNALLPGPQATAVGITFIARMTTQGSAPNFGVVSYGSGSPPGTGSMTNSIFYHNDAVSNQTNAAWTSAALALGRGSVSSNTSPVAARGLMQYTQPSGSAGPGSPAQDVNFRTFVSPTGANRNTLRTNSNGVAGANESQPVNSGFNSFTNSANGNHNGWVGVNRFGNFDGTGSATPGNTYQNVPGSAAILAVTARRTNITAQLDANGDPVPTVINYGGTRFNDSSGLARAIPGSDQDTSAPGVQSAWYAMYHFVFFPQGAATRTVTVSSFGYLDGGQNLYLAPGNQWVITRAPDANVFNPAPLALVESAVTFQVPSPGAIVVFVAASLAAARRRRLD